MRDIEFGSNLRGRPKIHCGSNSSTVVIASVGTSSEKDSAADEVAKSMLAAHVGADVVTDHSFYGDIPSIHRAIVDKVDVALSVVAAYEFAATYKKREWISASPRTPIDLLEQQVERGIDLVTIHASLLCADVANVDHNSRLIPTTSKGGGIIANYIRTTRRENPYYEYFDDILTTLAGTGVGISLGTTFRAASVCDGWDELMSNEVRTMGELVQRADGLGVPIMVEGFGHAAIDAIPTYIQLTKLYCHQAPYRVLPMATDRALGYDHISGAIAAAVAIANGADAVTAMSRAEHIGLPTSADMEEAIVAAKIAATSGELAKLGDYTNEQQMSRTRWAQGCKGDWSAAAHPPGAEHALKSRNRFDDQMIQCSMCGDFCGINAGIAAVKLGPTRLRDA